MKAGDRIKKKYPYKMFVFDGTGIFDSYEMWQMGCHKTTEQYGEGYGETFYNADGEGFIDIEILAIVDMPRKIKQRVLYKFDQILPSGEVRKTSKVYTVTIDKFKQMITGNAYYYDYELND